MSIQELLRISHNGYIDDQKCAEQIVDNLSKKKMKDILKYSREKSGLTSLTYVYDMSYVDFDSLSLLDTICLIGNMDKGILDGSKVFNHVTTPNQFKKLLVELLRRALVEAMQTDLVVRQFLGINIKTMFEVLENRHNDKKVIHLYNRIGKEWSLLKDTKIKDIALKNMNIGSALEKLDESGNRPWRCWNQINDYRDDILRLNRLEDLILIEGFFVGYREQMNARTLTAKLTEEYDDSRFERAACLESSYEKNVN